MTSRDEGKHDSNTQVTQPSKRRRTEQSEIPVTEPNNDVLPSLSYSCVKTRGKNETQDQPSSVLTDRRKLLAKRRLENGVVQTLSSKATNVISDNKNSESGETHALKGGQYFESGNTHTLKGGQDFESGNTHALKGGQDFESGNTHTLKGGQDFESGNTHMLKGGQDFESGNTHTLKGGQDFESGRRLNHVTRDKPFDKSVIAIKDQPLDTETQRQMDDSQDEAIYIASYDSVCSSQENSIHDVFSSSLDTTAVTTTVPLTSDNVKGDRQSGTLHPGKRDNDLGQGRSSVDENPVDRSDQLNVLISTIGDRDTNFELVKDPRTLSSAVDSSDASTGSDVEKSARLNIDHIDLAFQFNRRSFDHYSQQYYKCEDKKCDKHNSEVMCDECTYLCDEGGYDGYVRSCWTYEEPVPCSVEVKQISEALQNPPRETALEFFLRDVIMEDGRRPVIYLYSDRLLTMLKNNQSYICVDKTLELGPCKITMFAFRLNSIVDIRSPKQYSPLMIGPVMIHFDTDERTYSDFFTKIKRLTSISGTKLSQKEITAKRGISKENRPLVFALRSIFGNLMKLPGTHNTPTAARKILKTEIRCRDTLLHVATRVNMMLCNQRIAVEETAYGEYVNGHEGYRLKEWAKTILDQIPREDTVRYLDALDRLCE